MVPDWCPLFLSLSVSLNHSLEQNYFLFVIFYNKMHLDLLYLLFSCIQGCFPYKFSVVLITYFYIFFEAQRVKNPSANAGDIGDAGSIPSSGRYPEERNGNPLQYSCLQIPMDRGDWRATVHGVTKSQT